MSSPLHRTALRGGAPALLVAVLLAVFCAGIARADVFKETILLSASPFGQVENAHDPVISEDGRYMVFDASVAGVTGVWRRQITGKTAAEEAEAPLEQVAGGDAQLPSVSANGRFISFTTNEGESLPAITDGLIQEGAPDRESPGVYVRDMGEPGKPVEPGQPNAFTLVSAKNHSGASLTYEYPQRGTAEEERIEEERLGSTAAGRSAISADGNKVVFVTGVTSDLAGPGTPPLQVAVRDRATLETTLVSVRVDPATGRPAIDPQTGETEPVHTAPEGPGVYGAVYSPGSTPPFSRRLPLELTQLPGASISADGSTVTWLAQQLSEQAMTLSGETLVARYAEPLWRRIADGRDAPTRRVIGGSDPENPECQAHPEAVLPATPSASDPCQGPFATQVTGGDGTWNAHALADTVPRLSASGRDVAFLASAPLLGQESGFGLGTAGFPDDVYWVDMGQPTRRGALRQLTQFASGDDEQVSTNSQIGDIGISPGGDQIAFTTRRTVYPLGTPAYVSVPAAAPGLLELYDVDLANNTLTRVTRGYEGGLSAHPHEESGEADPYTPKEPGDGALSPSFSGDGSTLAFASTASNLVFGDGNTPAPSGFTNGTRSDGSDAFLIERETFSPEPTPQVVSAPPANPVPVAPWRLSFRAVSLATGAVELRFEVPGAGRLGASASSSLRSRVGGRVRSLPRNVAAAARRLDLPAPGSVTFRLTLRPAYKRLAGRSGGLRGTVTVTFSAPGHQTLRGKLRVRFAARAHGAGRSHR